MELNNKKLVVPTVIMVIILVVLIIGATYAYFSSSVNGTSTSANIDFTTPSVGNVSLRTGQDLKLNLSVVNMMQQNSDVTYYASITGKPVQKDPEIAIATVKVEGDGVMDCKYELNVLLSGTNNMYEAFQKMSGKSEGQIILTVNGEEYDLYDSFVSPISGEINSVDSAETKDLIASFRVVNKNNVNQNALAGTDLTIGFTIKKFTCEMVG